MRESSCLLREFVFCAEMVACAQCFLYNLIRHRTSALVSKGQAWRYAWLVQINCCLRHLNLTACLEALDPRIEAWDPRIMTLHNGKQIRIRSEVQSQLDCWIQSAGSKGESTKDGMECSASTATSPSTRDFCPPQICSLRSRIHASISPVSKQQASGTVQQLGCKRRTGTVSVTSYGRSTWLPGTWAGVSTTFLYQLRDPIGIGLLRRSFVNP